MKAQTQMEMNRTAHNDFKKADAELNKVYKQVMKILNEKEKKLMIKAQKDWLTFRDSHCEFEIEQYDGGSMQPLIHSNCLTERTNDRIEDLKAILEDEAR
ncbi:lysozyme inhibitor LprI family protein [Flavobacterium maritimum]|uniref:lysozyme inhibitor LprI family protein n=1 Tax=Flavobacterium maritimum TaxID=3149042 RepID=UPI0032B4EAB7